MAYTYFDLPDILPFDMLKFDIGLHSSYSHALLVIYFGDTHFSFYTGDNRYVDTTTISISYDGNNNFIITNKTENIITDISIRYEGYAPTIIYKNGENVQLVQKDNNQNNLLIPLDTTSSIKYNDNNITTVATDKLPFTNKTYMPHINVVSNEIDNVDKAINFINENISECGRKVSLSGAYATTTSITQSGENILKIVYWGEYDAYVMITEEQSTLLPGGLYVSYDGYNWEKAFDFVDGSSPVSCALDIVVSTNKLWILGMADTEHTLNGITYISYDAYIFIIDSWSTLTTLSEWDVNLAYYIGTINYFNIYEYANGRKRYPIVIEGDDCSIAYAGIISTVTHVSSSGIIDGVTHRIINILITLDEHGNIANVNTVSNLSQDMIDITGYVPALVRLGYGQYIVYNQAHASTYNNTYQSIQKIFCAADIYGVGYGNNQYYAQSWTGTNIKCVLNTSGLFKTIIQEFNSQYLRARIYHCDYPTHMSTTTYINAVWDRTETNPHFIESYCAGLWLATMVNAENTGSQHLYTYRNCFPLYGNDYHSSTITDNEFQNIRKIKRALTVNSIKINNKNYYPFGFSNRPKWIDGYSFINVVNDIIFLNIPFTSKGSGTLYYDSVLVYTYALPILIK